MCSFAQTEHFSAKVTVSLNNALDRDMNLVNGVTVSIGFSEMFLPKLSFKSEIGLQGLVMNPKGKLDLGVKYAFYEPFYLAADVLPSIDIRGAGHQVFGDYFAFYAPVRLTFGFDYVITKDHLVFAEVFAEKWFTTCADLETMRRDDFLVGITVGYRYTFFSE